MQKLIYVFGLRPYVDYKTGIVGLKRGISYQSLAEELYVEPHTGIKSGSPSKDQIRRAIKGLERAGLIKIESFEWKLVFHCLLVTEDYSLQNKPATNQPEKIARIQQGENEALTSANEISDFNLARDKTFQPAIPQKSIHGVCVNRQFEKFWETYPKKNAKQKAWEVFQELQPSEELFNQILCSLQKQIEATQILRSQGHWVPKWKFPANWLAQHCWEDEIDISNHKENVHAIRSSNHETERSYDHFWESCKAGAKPATGNNFLKGCIQ